MTTRQIYQRSYSALRQGRYAALSKCYDANPVAARAAKVSLNARRARFNGDPGYKEVQTKHFPVYERQPHFRGLAALQRVEEKVKS